MACHGESLHANSWHLQSQFASRNTSVTVGRYITICSCKLVGHSRRFSYFISYQSPQGPVVKVNYTKTKQKFSLPQGTFNFKYTVYYSLYRNKDALDNMQVRYNISFPVCQFFHLLSPENICFCATLWEGSVFWASSGIKRLFYHSWPCNS